MKVLLYAVFKDLTPDRFVMPGLVYPCKPRPAIASRSERNLFENACRVLLRTDFLSGTLEGESISEDSNSLEVRSLKAEQCNILVRRSWITKTLSSDRRTEMINPHFVGAAQSSAGVRSSVTSIELRRTAMTSGHTSNNRLDPLASHSLSRER